jgi:hypothetical protein
MTTTAAATWQTCTSMRKMVIMHKHHTSSSLFVTKYPISNSKNTNRKLGIMDTRYNIRNKLLKTLYYYHYY